MKLLGDQYSSRINFRIFPGSEMNPVVFTINRLSLEHPVHNSTEEIALLISNFEGFDEAPIKQILEIFPTGKAKLMPAHNRTRDSSVAMILCFYFRHLYM